MAEEVSKYQQRAMFPIGLRYRVVTLSGEELDEDIGQIIPPSSDDKLFIRLLDDKDIQDLGWIWLRNEYDDERGNVIDIYKYNDIATLEFDSVNHSADILNDENDAVFIGHIMTKMDLVCLMRSLSTWLSEK